MGKEVAVPPPVITITRPRPRAIMAGSAARQQLKVPKTLVSTSLRHSSGSTAEIALDRGEGSCHRFAGDDVDGIGVGDPARGPDRVRRRLDLGARAGDQGDARALPSLHLRDRATDAAARAGHDGDFICKFHEAASGSGVRSCYVAEAEPMR